MRAMFLLRWDKSSLGRGCYWTGDLSRYRSIVDVYNMGA